MKKLISIIICSVILFSLFNSALLIYAEDISNTTSNENLSDDTLTSISAHELPFYPKLEKTEYSINEPITISFILHPQYTHTDVEYNTNGFNISSAPYELSDN